MFGRRTQRRTSNHERRTACTTNALALVTHARRVSQSFQTLMLLKIACPCLAGFAALLLTGCSSKDPVVAAGPPVAPVTVATVVQRNPPLDVQLIGHVAAYDTVSVKSHIV